MTRRILISLGVLFLLINVAYAAEQQKYTSPDGRYQAIVITLRGGESRVVIKAKNGKTVLTKSYGSEDGEHGYGVMKAAWTPNSAFFVYSMLSTGGHQPWHFPIYYVSVRDTKIRSVDDYIGAVTDGDFQLSAPDTIKAVGSSYPVVDEGAPFEVTLSELVAREKRR